MASSWSSVRSSRRCRSDSAASSASSTRSSPSRRSVTASSRSSRSSRTVSTSARIASSRRSSPARSLSMSARSRLPPPRSSTSGSIAAAYAANSSTRAQVVESRPETAGDAVARLARRFGDWPGVHAVCRVLVRPAPPFEEVGQVRDRADGTAGRFLAGGVGRLDRFDALDRRGAPPDLGDRFRRDDAVPDPDRPVSDDPCGRDPLRRDVAAIRSALGFERDVVYREVLRQVVDDPDPGGVVSSGGHRELPRDPALLADQFALDRHPVSRYRLDVLVVHFV